MSANTRVCLYELQVSREIFPVFLIKNTFIYISLLLNLPLLAFLTSENDIVGTHKAVRRAPGCMTSCAASDGGG